MTPERQWRSLLFVSGTDQARLAKAHLRGASGIIVDLEDAVLPEHKERARQILPDAVDALVTNGTDVLVRINVSWQTAMRDMAVAVRPGVRAIVAPKIEDAGRLQVLSEIIEDLEREQNMRPGAVGLIALVESGKALVRLADIAGVERVRGLAFGPEDYCADLGCAPSRQALDLPCGLIAIAAAARGIMALGAPASIGNYHDLDACSSAARAARAMGMTGSLCVHPSQVEIVNKVFAPSVDEMVRAKRTLAAWAAAGKPGVLAFEGRMIDRPVIERMQTLLAGNTT